MKYPNDPEIGALCWCCGAAAEYHATGNNLDWCMPCKFADPDCPGPCNVEKKQK